MNGFHYIIILTAGLSLLLLWWLEWRRAGRRNLLPRLIAVTIAIASIVWLWPGNQEGSIHDRSGILVTDALSDTFTHNRKTIFTPESYLASGDTGIRQWMIAGYGLTENQLAYLQPAITQWHFKQPEAGITAVSWQRQVMPGKAIQVQGRCFNNTGTTLLLLLEAYATGQDSLLVPPGKEMDFSLRSPVKHTGSAVFRLQLRSGKKMLEDNPVPVWVTEPTHLRMLVMASSPDFENRFLQQWLGENGFSAVVRTKISKDKYQESFINRTAFPFTKLSTGVLDSFDVVVADDPILNSLLPAESNALQTRISDKGMGLLVRADTAPAQNSFYGRPFRLQPSLINHMQTYRPVLTISADTLSPLPSGQPAIQSGPYLQDDVTDGNGHTLVASTLYGSGKISMSTIGNSFHWALSGESASYGMYWTHLLTELGRKHTGQPYITPGSAIHHAGERIPVNRISDIPEDMLFANDSIRLPVQQDARLPYLWHADYWPQQEGWHTIRDGSTGVNTYIYGKNDWPMVHAYERLQATQRWMQQHPAPATAENAVTHKDYRGWAVCLLLISVCFLWVERKFLS
jgi:hypothetical protein